MEDITRRPRGRGTPQNIPLPFLPYTLVIRLDRDARPWRPLRFSLGAMVLLVALLAVVFSFAIPAFRERHDRHHRYLADAYRGIARSEVLGGEDPSGALREARLHEAEAHRYRRPGRSGAE